MIDARHPEQLIFFICLHGALGSASPVLLPLDEWSCCSQVESSAQSIKYLTNVLVHYYEIFVELIKDSCKGCAVSTSFPVLVAVGDIRAQTCL